MAKLRSVPNKSIVALVFGASLFLTTAPAQESFELKRMKEVAEAIHKGAQVDKWPRSDLLRLAPHITKEMLTNPSVAARESTDYSTWRSKDTATVRIEWTWNRRSENSESVPTELPETYKDLLLKDLTEEQRNDPNFIKERLQRALERYRESKLLGNLRVDMCRAPDANTAQDFLIGLWSNTTMVTSAVIGFFSPGSRIEGLGNVAFRRQMDYPEAHDTLMFIRDTLAVHIRGDDRLADEALPLAKKIDALIQEQPVLTKEQLQSLRPVVTIGPSGRKLPAMTGAGSRRKTNFRGHLVDYSVSVPLGQEIASLSAFLIKGGGKERTRIADGKIRVFNSDTTVRIRVEVITTGLLAAAAERDVTLLDEPNGVDSRRK